MRASDYLIDMGPGAGEPRRYDRRAWHARRSGAISKRRSPATTYAGRQTIPLPAGRRKPAKTRTLQLSGATSHNLQNVDVEIPLGLFVCVTGVSGSGKSSLVVDTLARALARRLNGAEARPAPHQSLRGVAQLDRLVEVDQSPIGRTPRSNAATYTGVWDDVRTVFAGDEAGPAARLRHRPLQLQHQGGPLRGLRGAGRAADRHEFPARPRSDLPGCATAPRFNRQTLAVRYRGQSIADVLAMSVDEAAEFFENHESIRRLLATLVDVGLGYLTLGQPSTTLSGGEAQRIKLAAELGRPIDRPHDVHSRRADHRPAQRRHPPAAGRAQPPGRRRQLGARDRAQSRRRSRRPTGSSTWVRKGGAAGGRIVVAGTPEDVAACEESHTGQFLHSVLILLPRLLLLAWLNSGNVGAIQRGGR